MSSIKYSEIINPSKKLDQLRVKERRLHTVIPEALKKALEQRRVDTGMTQSKIIIEALKEYLKQEKQS